MYYTVPSRIPVHFPQRSDSFRPNRGRSKRSATFRSLQNKDEEKDYIYLNNLFLRNSKKCICPRVSMF